MREDSFINLPTNLPVPEDDGLASHLIGVNLPSIQLESTNDQKVDLSKIDQKLVLYCYPMTGHPNVPLPNGWNEIPGARGCTPQSCSFRDHHGEFLELGAEVFGLSTQSTEYQKEMVERLHLPFSVLSDANRKFADALDLPTFAVDGVILLKRLTIIASNTIIEAVHYPVFPSHRDPIWVLDYLRKKPKMGTT